MTATVTKDTKEARAEQERANQAKDVNAKVLKKVGPVQDFFRLDCKRIALDTYRCNVWVTTPGGDLGFLKVGRIARSFVATLVAGEVIFN